jgi:hypothetical protein
MKGSNMRRAAITGHLALPMICCGLLFDPSQASQDSRDKSRVGLDNLSHDMSTCAAYFSLLSSIIEKSPGSANSKNTAERMKTTGQAMLTQAINVANYIGVEQKVPVQRVEVALKEMVETINNDPPNSLRAMHTKYGQPCDELLVNAPNRFRNLVEQHGD